jgi:hypothetical protein
MPIYYIAAAGDAYCPLLLSAEQQVRQILETGEIGRAHV